MPFAVAEEPFEGPLDFLLEKIEKGHVSINEVSLARITEGFLTYLQSLPISAQYEIAEFLVVASQLLLIKSRSLLPALPISEEETLSIEELQRRLIILQRIRDRARDLGDLLGEKHFSYAREAMIGVPIVFYPPPSLTADALARAFADVLRAIPKAEVLPREEMRRVISLEEKIAELRESLRSRAERLFSDLVRGSADTIEIIVHFLAILELSRKRFIDLEQEKMFGDIRIKKTPPTDNQHAPLATPHE